MSRAPKTWTRRPRVGAVPRGAAVAGLVLALAVAGCSAGQNTQTDSVQPAVNGSHGQVGAIMVRDAKFAYPPDGVYPAGGDASLVLTIVNTGATDDELVEVGSRVADGADVTGDRMLTARGSIQVGTPDQTATPPSSATSSSASSPAPSSTSSGAPSSGSSSSASPASTSAPTSTKAVELGHATIILRGLNTPLRAGQTYPVTFVFRKSGTLTLELPIAAPTTARPEPTKSD